MFYKVCSKSMHYLYGELPSPSHVELNTQATVVAYRYELDVLRFRTSQSARCFLHLFTFVHKMAHQILYIRLVRWVASLQLSTVGCFAELCFLIFSGVNSWAVAPPICKSFFLALLSTQLVLMIIITIIHISRPHFLQTNIQAPIILELLFSLKKSFSIPLVNCR